MTAIERSGLSQARVYSRRWFPDRKVTIQSMAEALYLEKDYWKKMEIVTANGVARAFKG